jgi:hypothetical protein
MVSHTVDPVLRSYPMQERTGNRGYFLKRPSVRASWQRKKTEPRSDSMRLACTQSPQSPGRVSTPEVSDEDFTHSE